MQHLTLGTVLAAGTTVVTGSSLAGIGVTLALGVAKEVGDARRGRADGHDLMWTAVGAALGAWAASRFRR